MKITVISTDNPAPVETTIDPVKLQDGASMDLVSIYHGLIYNITEDNNTIRFTINGEETVSSIKPGYYHSSFDIFDAIQACVEEKGLETVIQFLSKDNLRYIKMTLGTFIVGDDTLFGIILPNMTKNITSYVRIPYWSFAGTPTIGFIYVSIIDHSYINGKKSRLLGVVPLTGYGYESKSVSSTPIEITEFSCILIEIRGLDGEYIKFPRGSKTIVNLRITK